MYEDVVVTKVMDDGIVLVSCPSEACAGCKGALFCTNKGQSFQAVNDKHLEVKVGTRVRLYLRPSRTIMGTIIMLLFPLAFFPLGYILSSRASLSEGKSVLIGFLALAVAFLLVSLYFSGRKRAYSPTIASLLDE